MSADEAVRLVAWVIWGTCSVATVALIVRAARLQRDARRRR